MRQCGAGGVCGLKKGLDYPEVSTTVALPQRPKRRRQGLGRWLLVAAVIHAELLLVIGVTSYFYAPRTADVSAAAAGQGESIEIGSLDEQTSRKIIAEIERQEEKAKEEEEKKQIESPDTPGQVVDLARPREEKRPDNARFAAEYDSTVAKETKKYGRFDIKAHQGDSQGDADQSRPANPASNPTPRVAGAKSPALLAMREPGAPSKPRRPDRPEEPGESTLPGVGSESIEAPLEPGGALAQTGRTTPRQLGGGGSVAAPQASPGTPALSPSEQQLARAIGSGTQDHIKDLDDGDETALNAKRWKFASFFNRVKQQVRDHWKPGEAYRRRDPTGSIYGSKDRYTLLRVQLKPDGSLANVALETPSGVEFLDDEAIDAFKQAQPFPNPPKQLVEDSTGVINFKFGFFFELSGAPKMKVFRYNSM